MSNIDQLETELYKLKDRLARLEEELKSLQHYKEDYSPLCNKRKFQCGIYNHNDKNLRCRVCIHLLK